MPLACESEYSSSATVTDFQSSAESSRKRLSLALGAYKNFQPFSSKLQMPANAGPDDQWSWSHNRVTQKLAPSLGAFNFPSMVSSKANTKVYYWYSPSCNSKLVNVKFHQIIFQKQVSFAFEKSSHLPLYKISNNRCRSNSRILSLMRLSRDTNSTGKVRSDHDPACVLCITVS